MNIKIDGQELNNTAENLKLYEKNIANLEQSIIKLLSKRAHYNIPAGRNHEVKFAVIGDTHFGSIYEKTDALRLFLQHAKKEQCEFILHAGDVLSGHGVYQGHEFDVYAVGLEKQLKAAQNNLPNFLPIHFITGNHDASFKKTTGVSVGELIQSKINCMHFIGENNGHIIITTPSRRKYKIALIHPDGGTAYALSYHPQKIVESLSGGQKPHMLIIGHYHKAEFIPQYRNVTSILAGTFEGQTKFMMRKHSAAHIGGWIVKVIVGEQKSLCTRIQAEFINFYEKATME